MPVRPLFKHVSVVLQIHAVLLVLRTSCTNHAHRSAMAQDDYQQKPMNIWKTSWNSCCTMRQHHKLVPALKKTPEVPLWPVYIKKVSSNDWCCNPVKTNDFIRVVCSYKSSRKHSGISSSLEYRSVNMLMVYQCGDAPPYVLNRLQSEYWAEAWLKKKNYKWNRNGGRKNRTIFPKSFSPRYEVERTARTQWLISHIKHDLFRPCDEALHLTRGATIHPDCVLPV